MALDARLSGTLRFRRDALRLVAAKSKRLYAHELGEVIGADPAGFVDAPDFAWQGFQIRRGASRGGGPVWTVSPPDRAVPPPHLTFPDLLPPAASRDLMQLVLAHQADFIPVSIPVTDRPDSDLRRENLLLPAFPEFAPLFEALIRRCMGVCLTAFDLPRPRGLSVEMQLMAYVDGSRLSFHYDTEPPGIPDRLVSCVYFFHTLPRPFTGGELQFFERRPVEAGGGHAPGLLVEPRHNHMVFFPSVAPHAVLPVHCRPDSFACSRFSIAGWIRPRW